MNVGEPVNTSKDDFAFTYNATKKVGFFSSNRDGNDDIFKADPICNFKSFIIVKDEITGKEIEGATVQILDSDKKNIVTNVTDSKGETISVLNCLPAFLSFASKSGYETSTYYKVEIPENEFGQDVYFYITLKPIMPIITETEVILQPIYFEFNRSNITAEGAAELDKLVVVMNEHPNMVIFAKSHTDSRGSDKYNMNLSDRRAKSTVQYLISKGIAKDRISGQGFGESEPKVACKPCTEEQYAQNRRSEFLIVKK
jgi:outer membrane protein OmpA-like peptidoglycan-associated protein